MGLHQAARPGRVIPSRLGVAASASQLPEQRLPRPLDRRMRQLGGQLHRPPQLLLRLLPALQEQQGAAAALAGARLELAGAVVARRLGGPVQLRQSPLVLSAHQLDARRGIVQVEPVAPAHPGIPVPSQLLADRLQAILGSPELPSDPVVAREIHGRVPQQLVHPHHQIEGDHLVGDVDGAPVVDPRRLPVAHLGVEPTQGVQDPGAPAPVSEALGELSSLSKIGQRGTELAQAAVGLAPEPGGPQQVLGQPVGTGHLHAAPEGLDGPGVVAAPFGALPVQVVGQGEHFRMRGTEPLRVLGQPGVGSGISLDRVDEGLHQQAEGLAVRKPMPTGVGHHLLRELGHVVIEVPPEGHPGRTPPGSSPDLPAPRRARRRDGRPPGRNGCHWQSRW